MSDDVKPYTREELDALQRDVEGATGFDCEYVKNLRVSAWLKLLITARASLADSEFRKAVEYENERYEKAETPIGIMIAQAIFVAEVRAAFRRTLRRQAP